jgi:hypothetical protein
MSDTTLIDSNGGDGGGLEVLECLLQHGANRWLRNCQGHTAQDIAALAGWAEGAALLKDYCTGALYGAGAEGRTDTSIGI